ncbi:MAG: CRISPR-associated endoribonuclease Cas6, partial [Blastocatellia bacterium]|nr:CRISPR-associated endoribonuclease Cas6 [Blastocatellia bacterium]
KEFIEHFVNGLFQQEVLEIAGARFVLQKAEIVASPTFKPSMKFRAMSAITESVRDDFGQVKFLSTDEDWSEVIQRNLLRKYQALYGNLPKETKLKWTWDNDYIDLQNSKGHRSSALIDIHGIKVRGWLAPFKVEGSTELIKLGYETGFGARNSMGFGMAEHCM